MDTEIMNALDDDIDHDMDSRLISVAPFSPPSLSTSQYKQLELLQHLSLYSELLILFSGEKGMGKTFIAQALIASREDPDQSLMVDGDFTLTYLDILHQIAQHIDLAELDDVESLEKHIIQYYEQLQENDQGSLLLVVDQADQLTNETLLQLNQLAIMQPNALHVMLLATPILEKVLVDLPEPHAPLHVMPVEYLTEDESEIILLEQFPEQDWSGEQVDYMLQQSKGSPGKLVYIAQRLLEGDDVLEPKVKAKFPITHIAAMLLVASMLLVSFLYKNNQPVTQNVEKLDIGAPVLAEVDQSVVIPTEMVVEEEVDFNFIESADVVAADGNTVASNVGRTVASSVVKQQETIKSSSVSEQIISNSDKNTSQLTVEKPDAVLEERGSKFSYDEKLLIAAESADFVVQLFGSHSKVSAQAFIRENNMQGQLLNYRTEHKGKPWFVVVTRPFDSRDSAKKFVGKLSAKLQKQQPWIRSVEPIQKLLNARR